jgi:hypothetical protein
MGMCLSVSVGGGVLAALDLDLTVSGRESGWSVFRVWVSSRTGDIGGCPRPLLLLEAPLECHE